MRSQKLLSVFLLLLFFVPGVLFALSGGWQTLTLPSRPRRSGTVLLPSGQKTSLPNLLRERTSFAAPRRRCKPPWGRNQQNGCFYGEDGILQNLPDADEAITANNLQALQAYSAQTSSPCYFLLSPTAAAIAQQKIPSLALESLFNQKLYIQRCYSSLSSFRTIDAYNGLFSHQSEYLFYRTDSRLTALGCYYLYVSAGEKLAIPPVPWTISPSPTRCMTIGVI